MGDIQWSWEKQVARACACEGLGSLDSQTLTVQQRGRKGGSYSLQLEKVSAAY